jgi:hypothetical protein
LNALPIEYRSGVRIEGYGNPGRSSRVLTDRHAKVRGRTGHSFESNATRSLNGLYALAAQDDSGGRIEGYHDTRAAGVVAHGEALRA